ncbi:MAG: hypothetical protein WCX74_02520 [Candidatus Paceibacterota bacterium]
MDDCSESKELALRNVKLYLEQMSSGNTLVLIRAIIRYVEAKVLTWDEIGITPKQLLEYANEAYALGYHQLREDERKMETCFSGIQAFLLDQSLESRPST